MPRLPVHDGDSCLPACLPDRLSRAESPYATCYMLESSRVESNPVESVESVESSIEQSVDCWLLPTAARLVVGSNYAYFGIQLT